MRKAIACNVGLPAPVADWTTFIALQVYQYAILDGISLYRITFTRRCLHVRHPRLGKVIVSLRDKCHTGKNRCQPVFACLLDMKEREGFHSPAMHSHHSKLRDLHSQSIRVEQKSQSNGSRDYSGSPKAAPPWSCTTPL